MDKKTNIIIQQLALKVAQLEVDKASLEAEIKVREEANEEPTQEVIDRD